MKEITKRQDILQNYLDRGMDAQSAILAFKQDHPEYAPVRHLDKNGFPRTFEGAVFRNMRKFGMTAGDAIKAANRQDWTLYRDYQYRLEKGMAADMEFIKKGGTIR